MLRSVLVQNGNILIAQWKGYPIYSVAWAPENDQILYTNSCNLILKPIQAGKSVSQVKIIF